MGHLPLQGLSLLEALIKNGSERVIDDARDHLFRIRTLTDFQYHDETSDKGHGGETRPAIVRLRDEVSHLIHCACACPAACSARESQAACGATK